MSIKQIIEAIELGDASSVTALFDKLMASKLEECIEEKKQELTESLFTEAEELTEAYTAKGKVTHAGQVHSFAVKYADFPDHKDVEKQNPHLSKHHVEAVMRHFEDHGDDDMTNTHSTHQGAKVHMTQKKIKDMIGASQSERYGLHRKTMKRMSGIGKATDKLTK